MEMGQDFYVDRAVRDVSLKLRQGTSGIRSQVTLLRKLPGAEQIPGHDMTISAAAQILDTILTVTQNQEHKRSINLNIRVVRTGGKDFCSIL
jgi:hypothetical protein